MDPQRVAGRGYLERVLNADEKREAELAATIDATRVNDEGHPRAREAQSYMGAIGARASGKLVTHGRGAQELIVVVVYAIRVGGRRRRRLCVRECYEQRKHEEEGEGGGGHVGACVPVQAHEETGQEAAVGDRARPPIRQADHGTTARPARSAPPPPATTTPVRSTLSQPSLPLSLMAHQAASSVARLALALILAAVCALVLAAHDVDSPGHAEPPLRTNARGLPNALLWLTCERRPPLRGCESALGIRRRCGPPGRTASPCSSGLAPRTGTLPDLTRG